MTIFAEDDPRLAFVPEAEACQPRNGLIECHIDHWWIVHPERGLVFYGAKSTHRESLSPQCNRDRSVTEYLRSMYPWAEVRQVPLVFSPANI